MKTRLIKLFLTVVIAVSAALSGTITAQSEGPHAGQPLSQPDTDKKLPAILSAAELKLNMRKLWEDQIMWTRNVIFCIMDDLPGSDQAIKRLMKNQDDLGEVMKVFYSADVAKQLTGLLREHITLAADLLYAARNNSEGTFNEINKKWLDNADEIAALLSKANPNLKENETKNMMHDHLKFTIEQAVSRKKKDYDGDVKAYDKVHDEIVKMSDMFSDGIVKQFPEKFRGKDMIGMNK